MTSTGAALQHVLALHPFTISRQQIWPEKNGRSRQGIAATSPAPWIRLWITVEVHVQFKRMC